MMIECLVVQVDRNRTDDRGSRGSVGSFGGFGSDFMVIICCGNHKYVARVSCEMPMVFNWLWRIK